MTIPSVIDISHWNPTPDWDAIKAAGVIGVIHKATEGTSNVDDTLFARAKDAMMAGLKWSTYHFLRPGSMEAQMTHYLKTINPVQGERVCLDHEDEGVSLADLREAVDLLLADERDLQVCIYSGHVIKDQLGSSCDEFLAANTTLWIAHYTSASEPSWPKGTWPMWSLWQYTDKASVPGISATVDGDRWSGTEDELLAWFGPASSEPVPVPPPPVEIPEVRIETSGSVRVIVNGQVVTHE